MTKKEKRSAVVRKLLQQSQGFLPVEASKIATLLEKAETNYFCIEKTQQVYWVNVDFKNRITFSRLWVFGAVSEIKPNAPLLKEMVRI
jgi:hypothetical protein